MRKETIKILSICSPDLPALLCNTAIISMSQGSHDESLVSIIFCFLFLRLEKRRICISAVDDSRVVLPHF